MSWTLRKKIFSGYGITLVLTIWVLVWAFFYLWNLGQASEAILRENYRSILAADNMVFAIERQDSAVLLVFLGYEEQGWKQFRENESQFFQWLGRAKDNITIEGEDQVVSTIETGYSLYLKLISGIKPISISGPRKAANLYHDFLLPSFMKVREACIRLREINQENMYKVSDRATLIARRAIWSMGIIGIAAVGIGIGFSLFLSNLLVRPVQQMMQGTQKISEGNYDVEVSVKSSDELGRLTEEFNSMAKKLKVFHNLNIEQIMAEKRKSESIIRSIDDGIILIDAQCRVTDMNPMAGTILQMEPGKGVNRHFLELVKDEQLFDYIKQSIESGQPPRIEEKRRVLTVERDGGRQHFQFSVTPVPSGTGSLFGVVLLLRDVTRLTELDRLKSEFVMTASHELRTPLTSIGMGIDLLLESAPQKLNDKEQQLLSAAHEDLQRLKTLVNNLLDLSRIEAGKMEMDFSGSPVRPLIDRVAAFFKIQAEEKGVVLSCHVPEGLPNIRADANKIVLVLTNLIANAFHYTPQGGNIWLAAEKFGTYVQISVKDNGSGIPYEYQSKIFEKFVQVKNKMVLGGSGLGLAICREIVHAHGGTIWVDSIPGEGCRR
ncbi:MAG: ATP-binding protein [Deltaproteobacteria bacterium]|nr:ATP-binding protein [Deltaproteobacteria bacterium]